MKKLIIIFYFIILLSITLFSYLFIDFNLKEYKFIYTGFNLNYRIHTPVIYLILLIFLHILYFGLIKLTQEKKLVINEIKLIILFTILISLFSYPAFLSYDIFNYIATAKVAFLYKENPYIIMPVEFIGEPMLDFMHAANKTALYGPIWIFITGLPYFAGINNFILTLFTFKITISIFYLLSGYIIFKFKQNWSYVLFFMLNPLVIIETLISGHNDIVMMSLALVSLFLFKKNKNIAAISFFIFSVGIKFATIFLLPVILMLLINKYRNKLVDWNIIFNLSTVLMFMIFILSPIREEMYPWYAIWFYIFLSLSDTFKRYATLVVLFMFGLMLRYIPFMYSGIYNDATILYRSLVMFIPPLTYLIIKIFFIIKSNFKK